MQQTEIIIVDQPTISKTIVMNLTSTISITITDQINKPIQGASVSIQSITTVTDVNGIAILNEIPYGTQTITITIT